MLVHPSVDRYGGWSNVLASSEYCEQFGASHPALAVKTFPAHWKILAITEKRKHSYLVLLPQRGNHNLHNYRRFFFSCLLKTILIQFCNLFSPLKSVEYKVHFF